MSLASVVLPLHVSLHGVWKDIEGRTCKICLVLHEKKNKQLVSIVWVSR